MSPLQQILQLYVKGDFTPSQVCWSDNYHAPTPYNRYHEYYADLRRPPAFYGNWHNHSDHHSAGGGPAGSSSCRIANNNHGSNSGMHGPGGGGSSSTPHGHNSGGGGGSLGYGSGTGGGNASGMRTPYYNNSHNYNADSFGRTPLNGLPYTSQYYNPLETDSYLPSYDNEVQTRHYCFASPLYSTVWSPPSSGRGDNAGPSNWNSNNNNNQGGGGRRSSASNTPLFGSIRQVNDADDAAMMMMMSGGGGPSGRRHVYFNNSHIIGPASGGRDSSRSVDENESRSPQQQMQYAAYGGAQTPHSGGGYSARDVDAASGSSPREHVYAGGVGVVGENSSSPIRQYSGESSRSVEEECSRG